MTEKGARLAKRAERFCQVTSTGHWLKLLLQLVYPWTFHSACARERYTFD